MKNQLAITIIELKLSLRNFMSIFFAIAFPPMMLLLFGEMYGNTPNEMFGGRGPIDVLVPSYICMVIAVTGIMSLPLTIASYRERKILKRFKATPINQGNILFAQVISNLILTCIGITVLLIIGVIRYKLKFHGNLFFTLAAWLLIVTSIFSIGLVISGVAKNGKTAAALSYIIYFPMIFLSGATMPLEMFPNILQKISNILPLTHGVKLLRGMWFNESIFDYTTELIILICITIVCTITSIKFFKWE